MKKMCLNAAAQTEMSRTSSVRMKLPRPQVVTYVTRLPIPSSPSRTSVSFVNPSSTTTNDRRSSSLVPSAWSASPQQLLRRTDDAAAPAAYTTVVSVVTSCFRSW